jgi:hypothetical protein
VNFEWDPEKAASNLVKHGVSFEVARYAFTDPHRVIDMDDKHSQNEPRYHCYGMVEGRVLTVCFTLRADKIRIIGAAYWRKGRERYGQTT